MPGSRTASFRLNPIFLFYYYYFLGRLTPIFFLDISSSWVEISLHAEFQLPSMPISGSSMVGDKQKTTTTTNSVELEASLAPAEAEVGAVAKADQKSGEYL